MIRAKRSVKPSLTRFLVQHHLMMVFRFIEVSVQTARLFLPRYKELLFQ
jgi:hypothetical protein